MTTSVFDQELIAKAKEASLKAYTPFTHFPVGAAVLTKSGKVFCGCNVETTNFSSSMCAERNAICAAVLAGETEIEKIALYTPKQMGSLSCGNCRQWILGFTNGKDVELLTVNETGDILSHSLLELLPDFHKREV